MNIFRPNTILEEEIFTPRNLDLDCSTIGRLLYEYGEKFILSALEDGEYAIAVDNYLQLLDSLTTHFISEHSEAYQNYGYPSMIPFSDLKNAK